ncbi:MAG: SDR family oxidoreductase, partial [Victivallales bacterium]|nr:SDR family oxidoreductase [Victivallales bacterium]
KAEELAAECQELGRNTVAVQADITSKDSIEAMRETVLSALGAPDIIVNNAVIQYNWTTVLEQAEADYEGQFRSSVMQNVLMAQTFVPDMKTKGWGRVIGINTECTMQCWPGQSAYTSGKAGMDRVLRVLAREIGADGITVNQIAPGWMVSENRSAEGTPQSYLSTIALGHRGDDQEIANAVVFLASDLAGFITGIYLPVCGGGVMPGI